MDFRNIWIGGAIPLNRKKCINSFIAKMRLWDNYELISQDIYQSLLSKTNNPDFWHTYSSRDVKFMTDFIRLQLATENDNIFYADTDVLLGKFFDMNFNKPGAYIGQWGAGAEPFLFYVNNDCLFFKEIMFHVEQFNPENVFLPFVLQLFFKQNKGKFNLINEETFSHQRLGVYK